MRVATFAGEAEQRRAPPVRTWPVTVIFVVLGFALSWYPWALSLILHRGNGGPNPLGLFVAALMTAAVAGRWQGVKALLSRLIRVAAPLPVWAVAIGLPLACLAVAVAIAITQGLAVTMKPVPWSDMLDRFIFTLAFVALGEEPAWRGFLLPHLQEKLHPLPATLVLSVIWAVWHLPLMGHEFAWPLVPAFLVSLVGGALVLSWLFNASGGSVFQAMVMHALINTAGAGFIFTLIAKEDLQRFWWIYAFTWLGAGLLALITTAGRLGAAKS